MDCILRGQFFLVGDIFTLSPHFGGQCFFLLFLIFVVDYSLIAHVLEASAQRVSGCRIVIDRRSCCLSKVLTTLLGGFKALYYRSPRFEAPAA